MEGTASTPVAGKVVSAGMPEPAVMPTNFVKTETGEETPGDGAGGAGAVVDGKEKPDTGGAAGGAGAELTDEQKAEAARLAEGEKPVEMTDEQLKKVLEGRGIKIEGDFESLKNKLNAPAPGAEKTPEQKAEEEKAFEKRMLDHFIANGGSLETFMNLKQVASMDLKELSAAQVKIELEKEGFTPEEINTVLKERYYQLNPEELAQGENETPEEFAARKALVEKKIAFGSKKLESKSAHIKKQAEEGLAGLRSAIETQDLLAAKEAEFVSRIDTVASKLPSKVTIELGKVNDQQQAPVEYEVKPEDVAELVSTLKDPAKRKNILFNEDNSMNLEAVANMMLRNKILEGAVKAGYIEGGNRQVEQFEKIFPGRTAKDIGVGGAPSGTTLGRKGVFKEAGKPEYAEFPTKK